MTNDPRWKLDEAALQREVFLAFSRYQRQNPTSYLHAAPVGKAYAWQVRATLAAALRPFGEEVVRAAMEALARHVLTYGDEGSPDLQGWVGGPGQPGVWVGLELKRAGGVGEGGRRVPAGSLQENQEAWHAAARRRGAFIEVITEPGQVVEALERARGGGR